MINQDKVSYQSKNFTLPYNGGSKPPLPKEIPWQWGMTQKIQGKSMILHKPIINGGSITGGTVSNIAQSGGTYNNVTFGTANIIGGTSTNLHFNSGTITNSLDVTGTFTNPTINTGTLNTSLLSGGTLNNGVLGTPSIVGGTTNADAYQTGGTPGTSGSIVYIKTVSPGTTFGTLNFLNGLIISFS